MASIRSVSSSIRLSRAAEHDRLRLLVNASKLVVHFAEDNTYSCIDRNRLDPSIRDTVAVSDAVRVKCGNRAYQGKVELIGTLAECEQYISGQAGESSIPKQSETVSNYVYA